jgi:TetR/AcrR family transcriptional regulator, repressor for neighboring sulfatase
MEYGVKPKGKEDVMTAILEAATSLFAEKGVAGVSVRHIADRANVNHGLVHRHFGSKENLRLQVQNQLMQTINKDIGEPEDYADAFSRGVAALRKNEAFWKVLARTFLDGQFEGDVQSDFPFLQKMIGFITKAQAHGTFDKQVDPRLLVAGGTAMVLGLLVFENYLLPGTGLDEEPAGMAQDAILKAFMGLLVEAPEPRP